MNFIYEDRKLNYEVVGKGKPLLFLHGWGCDMTTFSAQREYFSAKRKCIFLDFSGFGKSDEPKAAMTVEDYKAQTLSLLDELKIKNCDIIAHSFGGRVAFKLMSEDPERVNGAVLVAPAGLKRRKKLKTTFKITLFKIKKLLYKIGVIKNGDFIKKSGSEDYKTLSDVMKETFIKVIDEDLKRDIKRIKTPTLLVYGIKDKDITPQTVKKLHKLIKSSDIKALFGGHFCFLDDCMRFNAVADRFLEGL